jgi:hypothetical protein
MLAAVAALIPLEQVVQVEQAVRLVVLVAAAAALQVEIVVLVEQVVLGIAA